VSGEYPTRKRLEPVPTVRELAMVLFRQRRVFVGVSAVLLAAAICFALFGSSYRAEMKVIVRRGRADAPVSAGENAPLDLTRMGVTEEELNSEVELLRDDEILRKVVEETGIGGRDWLHFLRMDEGHAERVERAARRLAKRLKADPIKKSNLISISYAAADPQLAAKVLRSVANSYLEKHTEVHRPSGEFRFFEQQAAESQRLLEESQQKLLRFTIEHGVVEAVQQRDQALQRLSEVDASARLTRIDLIEIQRRVRELEDQVAKLPERTTTQVRSADNPELLELRIKRTQLLTKFEPSHRLVQEVDKEIVEAQAALAAENINPVRDETTDKNPQYEWAKSELQHAQVQLKTLQAREAATAAQGTAYHALAEKYEQASVTQDDLLSAEKAAKESHLLYMKKREEARMDDALDQLGIVNVAIAQQPVVPALPVWSAWNVLVIGFFGAGTAGMAAAFAADYIDPAFRNPDEVTAYLDAPVLASLPRYGSGRLRA
jgi:uncharacterized protein involved in exopolysaccharide biosynthesis